jgi:phosphotransferase system enzyme I (PtsI)
VTRTLRGLGVSPGLAAAPALAVGTPPPLPEPVPVADVDAETAKGLAALAAVSAELGRRAGTARDATAAEILSAQAMMADDPVLHTAVGDGVRAGADAPHAIADALAVHRAAFEAAGGYLAERAADLDDLRDRAVAACLGLPMPGIPTPGHPFVLIARDLAPADTASLDPAEVVALVTESGGPTSHTAILARALGLPAVVNCPGTLTIPEGTMISVDGSTGTVEVGVDDAAVERARHRQELERQRAARYTGPGRTADGHLVPLLANVGSARDLDGDFGAEGVGLLRSELLYLDRVVAPSIDEQIAAYAEVFAAMPGRKVVVRTLDAGADKPLPFLHMSDEPNPALGVRGLRLSRQRPELLRAQLSAIATAAEATSAKVWVMAPMVATVVEAAAFVSECRVAGIASRVMTGARRGTGRPDALTVVDFLSIGTNDLSQYLFAADRQCGELADLLDPYQPALLRLVGEVADAGRAAGKPVSVCGEAAADPGLALVLAGVGVTSLSMSTRSIPAVRAALADHTMDECRRIADLALSAPDPATVRGALAQHRQDPAGP